MIKRSFRDRLAAAIHAVARWVTKRRRGQDPDPDLLDKLVEHIAQELAAMEAAAVLFQQMHLWIALEDFLVHLRILSEFFWPGESARSHPESAVLAEHYYKPWRQRSGGPPKVIRGNADAIDKQLAHLSWERVTSPQNLAASLPDLRQAMWTTWIRFLTELGSDSRAGQFRTALRSRCTQLGINAPANAT